MAEVEVLELLPLRCLPTQDLCCLLRKRPGQSLIDTEEGDGLEEETPCKPGPDSQREQRDDENHANRGVHDELSLFWKNYYTFIIAYSMLFVNQFLGHFI